jgi:hypothetical protein
MKLPVKIQISKDGAITININPVQESSVKAAAAKSVDRTAEDLELRLMSTDDDNEEKQLELTMDILRFAEKKLKSGKRKDLLDFLNKNKHRFSADQKEFLKDAIQSAKKKKES